MATMIQEFKTFISRGNVLDLAVGVIIGAAFGKIVNSIVNDILMPPLGLILGKVNFTDLKIIIGGTAEKPVTINYGMFIQVAVEFLIVAFIVFLIVKGFNNMRMKEAAKPAAKAPAKAPAAEAKKEAKK